MPKSNREMTLAEQNVFALIGEGGSTFTDLVRRVVLPEGMSGVTDETGLRRILETLNLESAIAWGGMPGSDLLLSGEPGLHAYLQQTVREPHAGDEALIRYTEGGLKAYLTGEFGN